MLEITSLQKLSPNTAMLVFSRNSKFQQNQFSTGEKYRYSRKIRENSTNSAYPQEVEHAHRLLLHRGKQ